MGRGGRGLSCCNSVSPSLHPITPHTAAIHQTHNQPQHLPHHLPHLVSRRVVLSGNRAEVVVGNGDHDAPAGRVGPAAALRPIGYKGLIRPVLVVDALVLLGGAGGGGRGVLGQADGECQSGVDPANGRG